MVENTQYTLHTEHCIILHIVSQSELNTTHFTLQTEHYTLNTTHFTLHTESHWTLYSTEHCLQHTANSGTVYIVNRPLKNWNTLNQSLHQNLHFIHCTNHDKHYKHHTAQYSHTLFLLFIHISNIWHITVEHGEKYPGHTVILAFNSSRFSFNILPI